MIPGGKSVVIELVVLSVIVTLVILARTASKMIRRLSTFHQMNSRQPTRSMLEKLRLFEWDDYIMFFNYALFITVIYSTWVQCLWGNNYVTAEDVVNWTPEDFRLAIKGATFGVVMEICKVTCVWGCKACLLILYFSMTEGLRNYRKAVVIVSVYVAVGYFVVIVCFVGVWCRPFHLYYDTIPVPAGKEQCMSYRDHMILDACLNTTGDAMMLCLPIPLLVKARLPLNRKCALIGIFGMGGLVILCAVLNRITNFSAPIGSLVYFNWYAGELATAMIVANMPHLWPLIARTFKLGSFAHNTTNNSSSQFTMQNMRKEGSFNPVGSQERITGNTHEHALAYSENKLDLTGKKGFSEANISGGEWEGEESHPDASPPRIIKTVAVTQYRGDA